MSSVRSTDVTCKTHSDAITMISWFGLCAMWFSGRDSALHSVPADSISREEITVYTAEET